MTDPTRPPDDAARTDAAQADALDRYLDALARGDRPATAGLDPTLAATVRRAHAMGDDGVRATTRRAGKAGRWEDLMRSMTTSPTNRGAISPSPFSASASPISDPSRGVRQPSRPRRLPGGPLGLVATLTLVLVIAASGLAVMLTAPGGGGEPTMLPAAFGATPTALPLEYAPGSPRLLRQPCVTPERPFDEVLPLLAGQNLALDTAGFIDSSLLPLPLPDGPTPDATLVSELESVFAQYRACSTSPLRLASLGTEDGVARFFADVSGPEQSAVDDSLLLTAWQEQGQPVPESDGIGRPDPELLLGLRELPDGRVAGYLTMSFSHMADGTVSLADQPQRYVVFAEQDGRWLMDDYRPERLG